MKIRLKYILAVILCALTMFGVRAEYRPNLYELALYGGCGYYVGDATPYIFQNVRESYGLSILRRMDNRWNLRLQASGQRIAGLQPDEQGNPIPGSELWTDQLVNIDLTTTFNFLHYGTGNKYDRKLRPFTPFISTGVGVKLHDGFGKVAIYMPFGIGVKWKFSEHVGLIAQWQHDICFADNLEPNHLYDNIHDMNGSNIFNCDLSSMLTVGMIFEFGRQKTVCRFCDSAIR